MLLRNESVGRVLMTSQAVLLRTLPGSFVGGWACCGLTLLVRAWVSLGQPLCQCVYLASVAFLRPNWPVVYLFVDRGDGGRTSSQRVFPIRVFVQRRVLNYILRILLHVILLHGPLLGGSSSWVHSSCFGLLFLLVNIHLHEWGLVFGDFPLNLGWLLLIMLVLTLKQISLACRFVDLIAVLAGGLGVVEENHLASLLGHLLVMQGRVDGRTDGNVSELSHLTAAFFVLWVLSLPRSEFLNRVLVYVVVFVLVSGPFLEANIDALSQKVVVLSAAVEEWILTVFVETLLGQIHALPSQNATKLILVVIHALLSVNPLLVGLRGGGANGVLIFGKRIHIDLILNIL